MQEKLTYEQILELLDSITGDDFCEELDCVVAFDIKRSPAKTFEMLMEARKKLGDIYLVVHGHNKAHSCHSSHTEWRRLAVALYDQRVASWPPAGEDA